MPPTIKEVAARARVSVSTVSRVLNDYPFVSDDARRRVLAAMEELDYRPDVAARSMRTGQSRAVGFVVSDISNPLFSAIAKGADSVLHQHGYSLVLANSQNDPGSRGRAHRGAAPAPRGRPHRRGRRRAGPGPRRAARGLSGERALRPGGAGLCRGRGLLGSRDRHGRRPRATSRASGIAGWR